MLIDRDNIFEFKNYTYKNYVLLSNQEKKMILEWRNHTNNRKWMFNQNIILLDNHLNFIESLKENSNSFYWLVIKEGTPIGGINLIHLQSDNKSAEIGYFLDPDQQGGGLGLEFVYNAICFAFEVIGLETITGNVMDDNKIAYILDSFMGFKYKKEYTSIMEDLSVKFHYCELTKIDFFKNIEIKNDIEYFMKFYKQNRYGNE